jgi:hypothetical protein
MKMKRYSNTGEKEVARLYILRHHRFTLPSLTRPGADPKNRKSFSLILIRSLCSVIMFFGLAMTCLSTTQIDIVGDISSTALGRGVVYTLPNGNIVLIDAQYSSPYFFAGRVIYMTGIQRPLSALLAETLFMTKLEMEGSGSCLTAILLCGAPGGAAPEPQMTILERSHSAAALPDVMGSSPPQIVWLAAMSTTK